MRKIVFSQILVFLLLAGMPFGLGAWLTWLVCWGLPLGDFRGIVCVLAWLLASYGLAILAYRTFLAFHPLKPGDIQLNSSQEFVYHVHLLFFLMLFYPVMRSGFVPVPLMRLFYQALGARLGENSYSAGILYDPLFITLGRDTLVGQGALLIPHAVEGEHLSHAPIRLGNNVTIGAYAIILGGAQIDDNALVAAGSMVKKDTHIPMGEIWGGVPARCLKPAADIAKP